jgi:glycosyltransferase involved in cell wall biosynthesis
MDNVKLSVLIPVYNEERTIDEILRLVTKVEIDKEVLVVDDGSTDGTGEILKRWDGRDGVRVILHPRNMGKGRAVRTAMAEARGEMLVIQDADLEYDPSEYPVLLRPIEGGRADVVYGSRFFGSSERRVQFFWHTVGNRLLTLVSNVFTNLNLTDMATCYKAFHARVVPTLDLESKGFGIDAEFTVKVARGGFRIFEVPISYFGRSMAEGKKIRLKDGFSALGALVKHSLAPRPPKTVRAAASGTKAAPPDSAAGERPA